MIPTYKAKSVFYPPELQVSAAHLRFDARVCGFKFEQELKEHSGALKLVWMRYIPEHMSFAYALLCKKAAPSPNFAPGTSTV